MSTTPNNEKSDKTVPFTTAEDAAKAANGSTPSSTAAVDLVNRVADKAHATIDRLATTAAPAAQQLQKSLEDTNDLLHDNAALKRSVYNRFPYLEPLNLLQVELLRRFRAGEDTPLVRRGIQLTMNGLATALRNSG